MTGVQTCALPISLVCGGPTSWRGLFRGNSTIRKIDFPELLTLSGYALGRQMANLNIVNIPKVSSISANTGMFEGSPNLIDLVIGAGMLDSFNINTWSPTNALSSTSQSLVEAGETFSSNLEKLLYNIRNHIAATLRTDVGNKTITFSSAIKAAIQADSATLNSFPSNWTIA